MCYLLIWTVKSSKNLFDYVKANAAVLRDIEIVFFNLSAGVISNFLALHFEVNILSFVCAGINFEC